MTDTNTPRDQARLSAARRAAICGLLLGIATGCTQKPLCPELGTCGGAPDGDWQLDPAHASCSEELYIPPNDPRLVKGDQPAARLPLPEESFWDWCDALTYKTNDPASQDANHVARFSYNDQVIGAAYVHYSAGSYSFALTKTGTYITDFPSVCVRGFGAMGDVCTEVQGYLSTAKGVTAKNIECLPTTSDPQSGCTCRYSVSTVVGGSGIYSFSSANTIVHAYEARLDKSPAADFPVYATFCSKGGSLQLTGANGAYLFNVPGLRTLDLTATTVNCTDGVQGPGEQGVDCGAACPMACP